MRKEDLRKRVVEETTAHDWETVEEVLSHPEWPHYIEQFDKVGKTEANVTTAGLLEIQEKITNDSDTASSGDICAAVWYTYALRNNIIEN